MSVLVTGAISEPFYYDIQEYGELSDLLDDLEFINVYPWLSVLTQFNSKTFEKEIILFSIRDRSTIKSISLQPNAQILFIDASDINYESYLDDDISQRIRDYEFSVFTRDGEINFPVYGSFKPSDLLRFSGIDLENYSNLGIYSSPYEDLIIKKEISQLSLSAKRSNSLTLLAEKEKTISVKILGAVEYPGEFEVSSNSSIQDFYSLIGGFQKDADLDAVVLQRKNIKERQIAALNKARDELNNLIVTNSISNDESFDPEMLKILTSEVDSSNLGRLSGTFGPGTAGAKNTIP
jgi:SLBB domain.